MLCPGETHLERWFQFWVPRYKMDTDMMGKSRKGTQKIIKGLEHLTYKQRLGLFSLERKRLRGTLPMRLNT